MSKLILATFPIRLWFYRRSQKPPSCLHHKKKPNFIRKKKTKRNIFYRLLKLWHTSQVPNGPPMYEFPLPCADPKQSSCNPLSQISLDFCWWQKQRPSKRHPNDQPAPLKGIHDYTQGICHSNLFLKLTCANLPPVACHTFSDMSRDPVITWSESAVITKQVISSVWLTWYFSSSRVSDHILKLLSPFVLI